MAAQNFEKTIVVWALRSVNSAPIGLSANFVSAFARARWNFGALQKSTVAPLLRLTYNRGILF